MNPSVQYNKTSDTISIYSYVEGEKIDFTAFLTDFKDQRASSWTSQEIYGRMDPIYTYKNTTRKITLAFDIPSFNLAEAKSNNEKFAKLKKTIYPVYSQREKEKNYVLSTPPFHRIRFANLIRSQINNAQLENGLLGWIDGLTDKPELESGFFIENNNLYAKLFKLNFTFNVIHEHPLGFNQDHKKRYRTNTR